MAQYGTLITNIGLAQIANAQITQSKVGLEYIALGDGNGAHYVPTQNQTALVHEVWRGPIAELSIDPTNSNRIIIDAVIPVTAGGFTIREIGIFDDKNQLIAIGQYPEKYKPQLSEGVSEETVVHFVIETNNAEVVKLTIDPTVIIASRNYVDGKVAQVQAELTEHSGQIATTEKLGHIKPDGTTISVDPETGVASANLGDPVYQLTDGAYAKNFAGNLNDLVESGLYFIKKGALNLPPNAPVFVDGFLVEVAVAEDASSPTNISVVQTVELYGITDASAKTYKRRGYHHIGLLWRWGDWVEGVSKLQENFVQAVLTAGTQDPTYPISYYKDSLGRVYVEGQARADTAGMIAFVMPVGYRPAIATQVVIPQTTNPTGLKTMTLQANGYFTSIQYTPSSNVSFNFSYRAGA